ncbi:glycoside hydrolase family protein [Roseibacterium beibuensis]|nr:glycoside hydrolase family protein [Roseibacterium beibuensis]
MIHGADNIGDTIRSSRRVRHLLGFYEPDGHGGSHQAGMRR